MLYLKIYDRNLLWYVAILTAIIALFHMMLSTNENKQKSHDELMNDIIKYTHYNPDKWKSENNKARILTDFHKLYNFKFISIIKELLAIFIAPIILLTKIRRKTASIVCFIENITTYNPKLGHICKYSDFEFDNNGNTYYHIDLNISQLVTNDSISQENFTLISSCKNNKLKQSIINFNHNYCISHETMSEKIEENEPEIEELDKINKLFEDMA